MELQPGDPKHIQGFILNKLYTLRLWVKPGGRPHGHTSLSNLPKGYPKRFRGRFSAQVRALRRMGFIITFPHSGDRELHVSAVLDDEAVERGLGICNAYRHAVGLPPLGRSFREIV